MSNLFWVGAEASPPIFHGQGCSLKSAYGSNQAKIQIVRRALIVLRANSRF